MIRIFDHLTLKLHAVIIISGCAVNCFKRRSILCLWGCYLPSHALLQQGYRGIRRMRGTFPFFDIPHIIISRWPKSFPAVRATLQRQYWEVGLVEHLTTLSFIHQGVFLIGWFGGGGDLVEDVMGDVTTLLPFTLVPWSWFSMSALVVLYPSILWSYIISLSLWLIVSSNPAALSPSMDFPCSPLPSAMFMRFIRMNFNFWYLQCWFF